MFDNGYTLAYREFLKGIRRQLADDLELYAYLADRSKVPSRRDFNNLYTEYKRNRYGSKNFTEMFSVLNMRINPIRTGGGGGGIPPCRHIFLDFSKLRSSQGLKLGDF